MSFLFNFSIFINFFVYLLIKYLFFEKKKLFLNCSAGHFSSLEVFYNKNVTLKVKSVSEKN